MHSSESRYGASQPSRFQGMALPAASISLKEIDTLLVLIEHGPLPHSLSNLFAIAAVRRAIEVERGSPPVMKMMSETQLSNSLQGFGEAHFLSHIQPSSHAFLLTAASLYKRQMAQIVGQYSIAGAMLDGFPHLVDDDVPIGRRDDPRRPLHLFVEGVVRDCKDPHVRELLRLSKASAAGHEEPVIKDCAAALETLQVVSFPFFRRGNKERPEIIPTLHTMILEWASGVTVPSICASFVEQHNESKEIAQSLWKGATKIAPGVFVMIGFPYEETDEVIRKILHRTFMEDREAKVVLEKREDRPASALSYKEAIAFERRLGSGEAAEEILKEVRELLQERGDTSSLIPIELGEMRERDPKDILEPLLSNSQYITDDSGFCYIIEKPAPSAALCSLMESYQIPLIKHNTVWACDIQNGTATPMTISFQARHLERFLLMVQEAPEDFWERGR